MVEPLESRELLATLFVATTGSDANLPGLPAKPFHSIQHAVTVAKSGDIIKVAGGTYGYDSAADKEGNYSQIFGTTTVLTLFYKQLTILGGYSPSNWNTYNPAVNQTVIDGGNQFRCVLVVGGTQPTSLDFRGFTVAHGLAQGIPARGGNDAIDGLGGGMLIDIAPASLTDVIFSQDRAIGNNTTQAIGGAGAGGGLAMRSTSNATVGTLHNVTFLANVAQGGSGTARGGFGQGGGLFTYQYTVNGSGLTFTNNSAIGGRTTGGGVGAGDRADGQGGALAIHIRSIGHLSLVKASGNQAIGGAAPNGDAGGGYGGGVYAELANLTLTDSDIRSNLAQGGNGNNGGSAAAGFGNGGGLLTFNSNARVERSQFISNTAQGGDGAVFKGIAGGGGLSFLLQPGFSDSATLNNCVVAGNLVAFGNGTNNSRGGGGGGLWLDGEPTTIAQSTIADNQLVGVSPTSTNMQGQGLLVGPSFATTLNLAYSIIADHSNSSHAANGFAALSVQSRSAVNLNQNLFANNSNDSNANGVPTPAGRYDGSSTNHFASSAGFSAPGSPQFDYRLTTASVAHDAAVGSTETVDVTGLPRIGTPDIGAFELRAHVVNDYDGDNKSDPAVFDQTTAYFGINMSRGGTLIQQIGTPGDVLIPVAGDYNGDGKTDLGIYDATTAYFGILLSGGGSEIVQMGTPGDKIIPVAGDYNGDGITDLAIYDQTTGYFGIRYSGGGSLITPLGNTSHTIIPVAGDYNGDGKTDLAIYDQTTGYFGVNFSGGGSEVVQMGNTAHTIIPVAGDYNGDGKTDLAIYDATTTYFGILFSGGGSQITQLGTPGHANLPVAGDYNGDGATDLAIFDQTSGTFGILLSGPGGGTEFAQIGNLAHTLIPLGTLLGGHA